VSLCVCVRATRSISSVTFVYRRRAHRVLASVRAFSFTILFARVLAFAFSFTRAHVYG